MQQPKGKRVLIVEDNDDNASVYQAVLEHSGFEVTRAADGEEALARVSAVMPDLILLDISLPIRDGWQVAAAIKADPTLSAIPIIVVTALDFEEERQKAQALGLAGFLAKPCPPRQVLAEVQNLIGPPAITA